MTLKPEGSSRRRRSFTAARRRILARLRKGLDLQWTPANSQDELHDRGAARLLARFRCDGVIGEGGPWVMEHRDPYSLFGISPAATEEEIRDAYRRLVRLVHRDRFDKVKQPREWADANQFLKAINTASAVSD
jgi:DnaJ-domain-containing protein 1